MGNDNKEPLVGAILAAGKGTRIEPLSLTFPKTMLRICNKPIIELQIETMKSIGIKKIFIVLGHLKGHVMDYLKDGRDFGVNITYVEQKDPRGIAHAVAQLEDYIKVPFLVFLGDIHIKCKDLGKTMDMLQKKNADAILITKNEEDKELIKKNFSVILGKDEKVIRVIEKPRYPQNNLKGCGIYLFKPEIFDAIRRTSPSMIRNEIELTDSIQVFIDDMRNVYSLSEVEWDININTAEDLLYCNLKSLKESNQKNIIGKNIEIHPATKIINSVICDNVVIKNPIEIKNSCILPDSVVESKENINYGVISGKTYLNLEENFLNKDGI